MENQKKEFKWWKVFFSLKRLRFIFSPKYQAEVQMKWAEEDYQNEKS